MRSAQFVLRVFFAVFFMLGGGSAVFGSREGNPDSFLGGVSIAQARTQGPEGVADLVEGLMGAVVNISTAQTVSGRPRFPLPNFPEGSPFQDFFEEFFNRQGRERPQRVRSLGSGFVIDGTEGLIVTNYHVIDGAEEIEVNFSDGKSFNAEVIGHDEKTDIALLKIKADLKTPIASVSFGDSDLLRVGDWVVAIGNPFGLGGSVTMGIVSARNRDINAGPYDNFIQTDAAINRGNSGGPLFNMQGEVVGINTVIISPSGGSIGIGFAVPSKTALAVIEQLRQFGETRRGWLGVHIQQVTEDIAEGLGLPDTAGALVADVATGGPSEKAGLLPGDVIISFDGHPIKEMRVLPRLVAGAEIGKEVELIVLRDGKEHKIQVVLGRLEEAEDPLYGEAEGNNRSGRLIAALGVITAPLTEELAAQYNIAPELKGVLITRVEEGSPAQEKRIFPGDIILEVAQKRVTTPTEIQKIIQQVQKKGRKTVLLLLSNREGALRFVAVPLKDEGTSGDQQEKQDRTQESEE